MADPLDPFRFCQLEFAADGALVHPAQKEAVLALAPQVTDLLVVSHGWNNNSDEAVDLYRDLARSFTDVIAGGHEPDLAGRTIGMVGVIWPSKKFDGASAAPPSDAASVDNSDPQLAADLISLADTYPEAAAATFARAAELLPALDNSTDAQAEFADLLRSLVPVGDEGEPGDSLAEFFALDGPALLEALDIAVLAETLAALGSMDEPGDDAGGVQDVPEGDLDPTGGGAAGLFGDMAEKFASKARALMNFTTYYTMKSRAGSIGQALAPTLAEVPGTTRLHLVGHSFGARLVTSAAAALPGARTLHSISLLQAAFSHYSFSEAWKPNHAGLFRPVLGKVDGPMIVTHTRNDKAVGIAYAMASALAQQIASGVGGPDSLFGGLGSNGAQKTGEARNDQGLGEVGFPYDFGDDDAVYNLRADLFIADHSAVCSPQVGHAILRAVAARP
ncbi:MAG: hypothetical protein ACSLE6_02865 [Mycobacterium sp.]